MSTEVSFAFFRPAELTFAMRAGGLFVLQKREYFQLILEKNAQSQLEST